MFIVVITGMYTSQLKNHLTYSKNPDILNSTPITFHYYILWNSAVHAHTHTVKFV